MPKITTPTQTLIFDLSKTVALIFEMVTYWIWDSFGTGRNTPISFTTKW